MGIENAHCTVDTLKKGNIDIKIQISTLWGKCKTRTYCLRVFCQPTCPQRLMTSAMIYTYLRELLNKLRRKRHEWLSSIYIDVQSGGGILLFPISPCTKLFRSCIEIYIQRTIWASYWGTQKLFLYQRDAMLFFKMMTKILLSLMHHMRISVVATLATQVSKFDHDIQSYKNIQSILLLLFL